MVGGVTCSGPIWRRPGRGGGVPGKREGVSRTQKMKKGGAKGGGHGIRAKRRFSTENSSRE